MLNKKIREAHERQGTNLVRYKNVQVRYGWAWGTSKSFYFCGGTTTAKEIVGHNNFKEYLARHMNGKELI